MPSPCSAEIRSGSPRPKAPALKRARVACAMPSALFTARDHPRALFAQDVGEGLVRRRHADMRPSITNRLTSAISTARSVKRRIRPCKLSSVISSRAGRVDHGKAHVEQLGIALAQSRASRRAGHRPTPVCARPRRLNSVDLPTLGRPTMARVKLIAWVQT